MSYKAIFEAGALQQLHGLPESAFDALLERGASLVDEPWDATLLFAGESAFRETIFGSGFGLLHFRVDDEAKLISIFRIVWIG